MSAEAVKNAPREDKRLKHNVRRKTNERRIDLRVVPLA